MTIITTFVATPLQRLFERRLAKSGSKFGPAGQELLYLRKYVAIERRYLHCSWLTFHVHDTQGCTGISDDVDRTVRLKSGYIVDKIRTCFDHLAHDGRLRGVN